jgi:hypothetical protein
MGRGNRSEIATGLNVKMTHLETGNDEIRVDTKPLFASTWIALYDVLRKHYHQRHVITPVNPKSSRTDRDSDRDRS